MASTNNEPNRAAEDGLQNLPEKEQKETKEILDEINRESANPPDKPEEKPEEGDKGKDGKPEEGKKPEPEKPKAEPDGKKPEIEPRRETKLVPAWLLERSKDASKKREKELLDKIEELSSGKAKPDESGKPKETVPGEDLEAEINKLAEDEGISASLAKRLVELARKNAGTLPADIMEKLKQIDEMRDAKEIEVEEAKFSTDFDRLIVPLIKAEYGDDVPAEKISEVKEKLKELAYSEAYAKVPYEEIYNGKTDFRNLVPPKKKGAEESRGGTNAAKGDETGKDKERNWDTLTDDEVAALSDSEFDQYSAFMESKGRK